VLMYPLWLMVSVAQQARSRTVTHSPLAENIIVANQGTIFLAGPPLVKAALGEEVDSETLGGGQMHATESGVVDHLAISDSHALSIARSSVKSLSYHPLPYESKYAQPETQAEEIEEPIYDPKELGGVVGTNLKKTWDMREVVARVVDGSRFQEWKKEYGPTIVTGFGESLWLGCLPYEPKLTSALGFRSSHSRPPCGNRASSLPSDSTKFRSDFLIAFRSPTMVSSSRLRLSKRLSSSSYASSAASLSSSSSTSRASWSARTPRRAYVIGLSFPSTAETDLSLLAEQGIAKNGAKMVRAVAATTVPKFTVIVGGSYGAGNYGMAGRA
jgi:hypothetical protein